MVPSCFFMLNNSQNIVKLLSAGEPQLFPAGRIKKLNKRIKIEEGPVPSGLSIAQAF